jgi:hypothetical protein
MTSLTVGVAGPNQLTEDYVFDGVVGLLSHQCALRAGNAHCSTSPTNICNPREAGGYGR